MFQTPIDARDEMFTHFDTSWTGLELPVEVETRWQGKEKGTIPDGYFIRVSTQTAATEGAAFLENGQGASDPVFDTYGHLFVQVFAPMSAEDSYRIGELLAIAARDIFLAAETPSGCWFRKAKYVEMPNDGKHYYWKVSVEYEFSETARGGSFGEGGGGFGGGGW